VKAAFFRVELCTHRRHERLDADDIDDARQIVSQHVQRHLGGDLRKTLHQEVRRPHSHLQRAEGMFTVSRRWRMACGLLSRRLCTGFQHVLMFPTRDAQLRAGRTAMLEHAMAACIRPIALQLLPILLVRVIVLQLFASRTAINIIVAKNRRSPVCRSDPSPQSPMSSALEALRRFRPCHMRGFLRR
jgi:hypothetical protein